MVFRIFVEKKKELANEAKALLSDARNLLGIKSLDDVRIFNRYDAENITEELFGYAVGTVFSEPQLDRVSDALEADGIEDMQPIVTSRSTYIAPFINAEGPQYLVVEDNKPNKIEMSVVFPAPVCPTTAVTEPAGKVPVQFLKMALSVPS